MSMRSQKPVVIAARLPSPARPKLEITPNVRQYEQLCRDMKTLRRLGAISNTDAIVDAVHERAERLSKVSQSRKNDRAARHRHPVEQQEASPDAARA